MFNQPATILPLYTRVPSKLARVRRGLSLLAQLGVAAGYGAATVALPQDLLFLLMIPVIVCLLIVLWLLPDRGVFPIGAIERSYFLLILLMVAWPSYLAIVLPGLPWLTPTRLVLFLVTLFFLYSVSTSSLLRLHLLTVARASPSLWTSFILWQAAMLYTLPFSHQFTKTLKLIVDDQLRYTELFFLGCLLFVRRGMTNKTIALILALAVLCSVESFIELRLEYPPWAKHIPSFMRIDDASLSSILGSQARSADGIYRVRGPYSNALSFAEFLALCSPFILHWLFTGRTLMLRVAMAIALGAVFCAILNTQSRLGLVGTMTSVVVYVPMWAYRQWRSDRTSIIGPATLIGAPLVALALMGVVFSSHTLSQRVLGGGAQAASTEARAEQRRSAIPKILSNPIGHGLGQSANILGFVATNGMLTIDNHYLSTLLDLGVVGAAGFYTMFLVAAWLGIRIYLRTDDRELELAGPLAALFIVFLVVKTVLSQEDNQSLVLLLLGMMMALNARENNIVVPALERSRDTRTAAKPLTYRAYKPVR